ncbi:MAG: efflux RND transporter periplasmic adaptor subunit [Lentisphaeria bacterium]|nr:efflux RND transporter periplasmic adaptor subunit [Lentisphaeria bacterium]
MDISKKSGLLILSAVFAAGAFAAPGRSIPAPAVVVDKVTTAPDVYTRRYVGSIQPINNVYSTAKVSGDLLSQGFKDGEFVKAGQLLFEIDPTRYIAAVKSTEAKISQIKARLAYAQSNLDRKKELMDKKAVSLDTYQSVLSERDTLKAQLLEAEAALILAKDDLKNTRIIAMTTGKTGKAAYSPGNYVTPSSGTLVQTVQTDPIRVRFSLSARDYLSLFGNDTNIRKHGIVHIKLADDSMYGHKGEIEIVDSSIQQDTDTVRVWARFKNPDNRLMPYGVVTVILTRDDGKKYPAVIPSAVSHDVKGSFVYAVDEKTNMPAKKYVILGNALEDLQVIRSGIKPGETVITEGFHKILPGVPVKPVKRGAK